MLLEELERRPLVGKIPCFIQGCNRAARQNARILDTERVQVGFSDNAPEGVSPAYEVDHHAAILANPRFRTASYWLMNACYLQSGDEGTRSPFSGEPIKVDPCQRSAVRGEVAEASGRLARPYDVSLRLEQRLRGSQVASLR